MISALQTGVMGMERASDVVDRAAYGIANAAAPPNTNASPLNAVEPPDLAQNMVNMMVGHRTYDANAKVIEVAAKMLNKIV